MKMKRIVSILLLVVLLLSVLTACSYTDKVEYTADNNADVAEILSELKKSYHLADVSKNEILIKGTKTNDNPKLTEVSVDFTLYLDSDDWNVGNDAARFVLKRIWSMCDDGDIMTHARVYLNEDGYYVRHSLDNFFSEGKISDVVLTITEFDSEILQTAYEDLNEQYHIRPHSTSNNEGIRYMDADFIIRPRSLLSWDCDAKLLFDEDYSADELIEIGQEAYLYFHSAMDEYFVPKESHKKIDAYMPDYNITISGKNCSVIGEFQKSSEEMVWEIKS